MDFNQAIQELEKGGSIVGWVGGGTCGRGLEGYRDLLDEARLVGWNVEAQSGGLDGQRFARVGKIVTPREEPRVDRGAWMDMPRRTGEDLAGEAQPSQ